MEAPGDLESMGGAGLDAPYLCYLLLGMGTLFPWNALITAADYWEARYPGRHTDRLLTVAYLPVNLVVIAAMVHWHARVLRPWLRVMAGLVGFTLAIAAVPLLDLAPASSGTLAALLLLVAACGVCDGLAQGALFGEAALLPPRFTQALVAGTAVSGVVVSVLRVITKAILPDTEQGLRQSANLYFSLAALVCAACTVVYSWVLPRLPAVRQFRHAALEAALHGDDDVGVQRAEGESPGSRAGSATAAPWKQQQQQQQQQPAARSGVDVELSYEDHAEGGQRTGDRRQQQQLDNGGLDQTEASPGQALLGSHDHHIASSSSAGEWVHHLQADRQQRRQQGIQSAGQTTQAGPLSAWAVFRMLWRLAVANALIYTITLSIFPGVLAEDVHSVELGSWYPVALLTAFNCADWAGKSLPGVPALRLRNERLILAASLLRLLFVPAFHFSAVGGAGPALIGALTLLLGASNGYLTAAAMMGSPSLVPPAAGELAGNMMVLFLILGLCIGAGCGFLWLL